MIGEYSKEHRQDEKSNCENRGSISKEACVAAQSIAECIWPAIFRCLDLFCEMFSAIPLHAYNS
jgi:hypothetical protein